MTVSNQGQIPKKVDMTVPLSTAKKTDTSVENYKEKQ